MRPAETPDKLTHLQTLIQRKLIAHERDGKVRMGDEWKNLYGRQASSRKRVGHCAHSFSE